MSWAVNWTSDRLVLPYSHFPQPAHNHGHNIMDQVLWANLATSLVQLLYILCHA